MKTEKHNRPEPPLYGLILAGGQSTRMGQDKGLIQYGSYSQIKRCSELLSKICQNVYLSARHDQYTKEQSCELDLIIDQYHDIGPISGILSAMQKYPKTAFLVLAVDLPLLDLKTLQELVFIRDINKDASSFINTQLGVSKKVIFEPMCAIYEPSISKNLIEALSEKEYSLQKILRNSNVEMIKTKAKNALHNVNTPTEYRNYLKISNFYNPLL